MECSPNIKNLSNVRKLVECTLKEKGWEKVEHKKHLIDSKYVIDSWKYQLLDQELFIEDGMTHGIHELSIIFMNLKYICHSDESFSIEDTGEVIGWTSDKLYWVETMMTEIGNTVQLIFDRDQKRRHYVWLGVCIRDELESLGYEVKTKTLYNQFGSNNITDPLQSFITEFSDVTRPPSSNKIIVANEVRLCSVEIIIGQREFDFHSMKVKGPPLKLTFRWSKRIKFTESDEYKNPRGHLQSILNEIRTSLGVFGPK